MIFKFNKKKFFNSLKQGDVLFYRGPLSEFSVLFEFGHYDSSEDKLYWQTARVILGREPEYDKIGRTAKVANNGRIFEQEWSNTFTGLRRATSEEIERFEEAYDCYQAWNFETGKLQRQEVYMRPRHDMKLTRIQLMINPPEYLYFNGTVFKSAGLSMTSEKDAMFLAKDMIMYYDDRIELIPEGKYQTVCYYYAHNIREATDTERKLLILRANEVRDETERKRRRELCNILAGLAQNARKREAKVKKKVVLIEKEDMKKDVDKRTEERRIAELQHICDRMKTFHTKILVSKGPGFAWFPALYGYLTKQRKVMVVGGTIYKHCLLYKDHRWLLGHLYNYEDVPPEKPEK